MSARIIQGGRATQFIANENRTSEEDALKGGGGGGTFDTMEARVAVLENEVKHIREDIGAMRTDVHKSREDIGTIKTDIALAKSDIARLPSKEWNVKALIGLATFITALTVLINFGPALIRLLRAH
ncbi:hypothetical protein [Reyranella sp.]|uniref:hypothetical protein n=1 Tax=Reyranella sp. TaxID=1929291 RepID=UPI003C7BC95F